jgi:hypothetical protein
MVAVSRSREQIAAMDARREGELPEITPAMIEAGIESLREIGALEVIGPLVAQAAAMAVFSAMQATRE